jgi:hypothetical protein
MTPSRSPASPAAATAWFVLVVLAVRVAVGIAAWQMRLYPQSAEDLARYWFLQMWWQGVMPHAAPDGRWHPWIEYTPGLPLAPLLLTPLALLGAWHGVALALAQSLLAGAGAVFAGLAAREATDRPEAAWLGAALASAHPSVVVLGFGFLSEPTFLGSALLALWGLARWWRGGGVALLAAGIVLAQLTRYEGWTIGGLLVAIAVWRRWSEERRLRPALLLKAAALAGAVPLAWVALHAALTPSPTYFLYLTRIQYEVNIADADRASSVAGLWRAAGWPVALALAAVAGVAWRAKGAARLLAAVPLLQAAQVTLFQLGGIGAAHYPERLWYGMWMLGSPALAVLAAEALRRVVAARVEAAALAAAVALAAFGTVGALRFRAPYSGRELLVAVDALLEKAPEVPDSGPLVYVLVDRDTFDMTAMQLIAPKRWESPPAASTPLESIPASVRVLATSPGYVRMESLAPEVRARLAPAGRVTSGPTPWDLYTMAPVPDMPGARR